MMDVDRSLSSSKSQTSRRGSLVHAKPTTTTTGIISNNTTNTDTEPQIPPPYDYSAQQYQSLKYNAAPPPYYYDDAESIPMPMPFAPQQSLPPLPPTNSSVFFVDSKGSEQQNFPMNYPTIPMPSMPMPMPMAPQSRMEQFIPYDEHDILKDIEMDSMLYGVSSPTMDIDDDVMENEDLTIKLRQEINLFNPELVHTQIIHPPEGSPERTHVLFDRAFMPRSPEFDRLSQQLNQMDWGAGMSPPGFGYGYRRNSQNLFVPLDEEQRISDMQLRPPPQYMHGGHDIQSLSFYLFLRYTLLILTIFIG